MVSISRNLNPLKIKVLHKIHKTIMSKTKLSAYTAKRRVCKIINNQEQLVGEYFKISYNAAIPAGHRMLR